MSLSQIYEGWRNKLIPPSHLKELIETTSKERMEICNNCELSSINAKNYKTLRIDVHCTNCGCTLDAKTKCLSCECPLKKWTALITPAQEEEMNKTNNNG